jgi:hypothetical protein
MKRTLLIFSIFIVSFAGIMNCSAQITLGSNDFPHSGKIYNLSTATPFGGMDATLTGTNYNWDYSLLSTTRTGGRVDTFLTLAQTASLYALYFAFGSHVSNQAIAGTNFTLGSFITVTNAFNFFDNTSSSYNQTGFGANVNIIPTPIGYTPEDVVYKFPVAYGNVDSCAPAYVISIPNLIYYGVNMKRHNQVDGWGMLTTPYGTFNTLRIKSTIDEIDTFYLDTLHFGFGPLTQPTKIEYKWLGAGKGEPLLQVNMTGAAVTSIVYQDSVRTTGITVHEKPILDLNVFPNPASDKVFMQYSISSASDVHIDITDLSGAIIVSSDEKLQEAGNHIAKIDLPHTLISFGNYFVRLRTAGDQIIKPLMIAK